MEGKMKMENYARFSPSTFNSEKCFVWSRAWTSSGVMTRTCKVSSSRVTLHSDRKCIRQGWEGKWNTQEHNEYTKRKLKHSPLFTQTLFFILQFSFCVFYSQLWYFLPSFIPLREWITFLPTTVTFDIISRSEYKKYFMTSQKPRMCHGEENVISQSTTCKCCHIYHLSIRHDFQIFRRLDNFCRAI